MLLQHFGKVDGLVEIPTAGGPIRGRNAHQNRHALRDGPTHGIHNLDQEPRATGQIATIFVITLIAQRVKELRNQIAMRGMNLNRLEAGGHRTARRHESHPRTARAAYATHRTRFQTVPW